jgi:hypothetical protein
MNDEPIIVHGKRAPDLGNGPAKLCIVQPNLSPTSTRVWLNGMEISSCLQNISFDWTMDKITKATITIVVGSVDIDAVTLVNLVASSRDPLVLEDAIRTLKRAKAELHDE